MSAAGSKLRLGPLPKTETVKLTITVPVELKVMLDRYAELHGRAWGEPVDAATLAPHMLQAFMARDRAFHKDAAARHGHSRTHTRPDGKNQRPGGDGAAE